jgi:hypothetical protein
VALVLSYRESIPEHLGAPHDDTRVAVTAPCFFDGHGLKVGVGILPTSPVSGDGVRNLTTEILDGSSVGPSAPCDQKKTCTSYAHFKRRGMYQSCTPG